MHRQQHESQIDSDSLAITTAAEESETILVVEDEDFVREVTYEVLRSSGYVVLKAKNATQAKELLRKSSAPSLLITDIVLPGQNGCELARDICAANPSLVTIFMSGYPKNVVAAPLSQQRHSFYLPKPFSASSLLKMVRSILAKGRKQ
ncbi:MAG TPA: response regulator [Terriglobales bacterium]|nr:response regulator [Terriglobales bacterium]